MPILTVMYATDLVCFGDMDSDNSISDQEAQAEEVLALRAILGDTFSYDDETNTGIMRIDLDEIEAISLILASPSTVAGATAKSKQPFPTISQLPPIHLDFVFPDCYPSENPPTRSMSAFWLNMDQISVLEEELDRVYEANKGQVVLFQWNQILRESTANILNISKEITVGDEKALEALIAHDAEAKAEKFANSHHLCEICCSDFLGDKFELLIPCDHYFCRECLRQHCETRIADGQAAGLSCPHPNCEEDILPTIVKGLVSYELYSFYEKNLFEMALRSMSETAWCPRLECQQPADTDEDKRLGLCQICRFAFCLKCEKAYHGPEMSNAEDAQDCMNPEEHQVNRQRLAEAEKRDLVMDIFEDRDSFNLALMYVTSKVHQRNLSMRYGREAMHYAVLQHHNRLRFHRYKTANTSDEAREKIDAILYSSPMKNCPKCGIPCAKISGCNAVDCAVCRCSFCWGCLSIRPLCMCRRLEVVAARNEF